MPSVARARRHALRNAGAPAGGRAAPRKAGGSVSGGGTAACARWLGGDWLAERDGPGPDWHPGALGQGAVLASSGRAAIADVLRALAMPGSVVLLPAYACPALTQAVLLAGCQPDYYPGDIFLRPDWAALASLARTKRAAAAVVVHPWGWLQDGDAMRRLRASGVAVLEDASHTLTNASGQRVAGPDAATAMAASLRKTLPVAAGGLGRAWQGALPPTAPAQGPDSFAAARREALRQPAGPSRHRALQRAESVLDRQSAPPAPHPSVALALQELAERPPAAGVGWRRACRTNWSALREALAGGACSPWADTLPEGVCPTGFVVRHPDRSRLAAWLLRQGIEATLHWPVAPVARPKLTRPERLLAGSVLTLPCDGRFTPEDMDAIAAACRSLPAGGRTNGHPRESLQ